MIHQHEKLELLFQELCEILKPKLECVDDSLEYVQVGEYGLALEFIGDWCVDAEPKVILTVSELLKVKEVGISVNNNETWIELLPLLIDSELAVFPITQLDTAESYIEQQLADNPIRSEWLSRINKAIQTIKKSI